MLLLAATFVSAGCDDDNTTIIPPTPPPQVNEEFSGTLTPNSVRIHEVRVSNAGAVTAVLTDITEPDPDPDPDNPVVVGLDIGPRVGPIWQVVVSRVNMTEGQANTATATTAGNICIRIYDVSPSGLPGAVDYVITVRHF